MTNLEPLIHELRESWSTVDRVDPYGKAYNNLVKLLDSLSQNHLRLLVDSNIKFVSKLAKNRIKA